MKFVKLFAAAAMALSLAACTTPAQDTTVTEDLDEVTTEDSQAVKEGDQEAQTADENAEVNVDFGTPETTDEEVVND